MSKSNTYEVQEITKYRVHNPSSYQTIKICDSLQEAQFLAQSLTQVSTAAYEKGLTDAPKPDTV